MQLWVLLLYKGAKKHLTITSTLSFSNINTSFPFEVFHFTQLETASVLPYYSWLIKHFLPFYQSLRTEYDLNLWKGFHTLFQSWKWDFLQRSFQYYLATRTKWQEALTTSQQSKLKTIFLKLYPFTIIIIGRTNFIDYWST